MANRQALVVFVTDAPPFQAQVNSLIAGAVARIGFRPGPWTFNSQQANFRRNDTGTNAPFDATVVDGPWEGLVVSLSGGAPAATFRAYISSYRQNFLDGPEDVLIGTEIRPALGLLGARWTKSANRTPSTAISWDRGIPDPIVLEAEGAGAPSSGGGSSTAGLGLLMFGAVLLGVALYSQDTVPRARRA